jgi:heme/copper-type cytochrome/quinol oxidase subunit 4
MIRFVLSQHMYVHIHINFKKEEDINFYKIISTSFVLILNHVVNSYLMIKSV